jgi:hypothetical protein
LRREASKLRLGVFYAVYLLLIGAVFFRMIPHYLNTLSMGLSGYFCLFGSFLSRLIPKSDVFIQAIFVLELVVGFVYHPSTAPKDYFTNLVFTLCGHVVWNLSERLLMGHWFCLFT